MADPQPDEEAVISRVRSAFNSQAVPERPSDSETQAMIEGSSRTPLPIVSIKPLSRIVTMTSSIPLIIACALIAFSIWPVKDSGEATQTVVEVHDQVEVPLKAPLPDDSATKKIADLTPQNRTTSGQQPSRDTTLQTPNVSPTPKSRSRLLQCIEATNDAITSKQWDSKALAEMIGRVIAVESEKIAPGLESMGIPEGVNSIRPGVHRHESWLVDSSQTSFTYDIDVTQLESNARMFVDGLLGENLFDSILEGIREDSDGPMIDLRAKLFDQINDRFVLVLSHRAPPLQDKVLLAIEIDDPAVIEKTLVDTLSVEPDTVVEGYLGHQIYLLEAPQVAVCLARSHVLIADVQLVKKTLQRIQPAAK